jgi:hypothetical protein
VLVGINSLALLLLLLVYALEERALVLGGSEAGVEHNYVILQLKQTRLAAGERLLQGRLQGRQVRAFNRARRRSP